MTTLRCLALLWCLCMPTLATAADEESRAASPAIAEFLEHTRADDEEDGDSLERQLFLMASEGATVAAMEARTVRDHGVPPALARELVALALRTGAIWWDDDEKDELRRIEARRLALVDEHPGVWLAFEEAALDVADTLDCDGARIDAVMAKWADPDAARLRLAPLVYCAELLSPRTSAPGAGTEAFVAFARNADPDHATPLALASLRVAVAKLEADPASPPALVDELRAQRLRREVLDERFSAAIAALPGAESPQLAGVLAHLAGTDRLDIAAAALVTGHPDLARRWRDYATASSPLGIVRPEDLRFHGGTTEEIARRADEERILRETTFAQRLDLLAWALGERSGDPFALLVQGGSNFESPFRSDPWRALAARVAIREGYPMLAGAAWSPNEEDVTGRRQQAIASCHRCAPELLAAIEATGSELAMRDPAIVDIPVAAVGDDRPADLLARIDRAIDGAPLPWQEQPLPPALRTPRKAARDDGDCGLLCGPSPQGKGKPPAWRERLPRGELVRWERDGERIVAVTASQTLDPVGELSSGGYWISVSTDAGKTFAPPLYTGLRVYAPYVVRPDSKLALMDGDTLQLEVAVRELDAEKVMLPPIVLPMKRESDDLLVRIPLADLQRDGDDDGIADAIEAAMLLDPLLADTDGDGIRDGADMLPNVPWRATGNDDRAAALAVALDEIFDRELGAIITSTAHVAGVDPASGGPVGVGSTSSNQRGVIFLEGPADALARMHLRKPVVVLSQAQVARLRKVRGAFYPFRIDGFALNRAGDEGVVTWTAGWTGGAFRLHKRDGTWTAESTSSWITSTRGVEPQTGTDAMRAIANR